MLRILLSTSCVSSQSFAPLGVDLEKCCKIQMKSFKRMGDWEADTYFLPMTLADRDRPYFPLAFMVIHQDSGFVLNSGCGDPEGVRHQLLGDAIVKAIKDSKTLPDVVYVRNDKMASSLAPLAKNIGFKIKIRKHLNAILTARRSMESFFKKEPPGIFLKKIWIH